MTARAASELLSELLYDSEAALRLVDSAIEDIRAPEGRRTAEQGDAARAGQLRDSLAVANGPLGVTGLSQILARGYSEVVSVLGSLRESRAILDRAAADELHDPYEKLRYASSVLTDMEHRLAAVATVLDPTAFGGPTPAREAE